MTHPRTILALAACGVLLMTFAYATAERSEAGRRPTAQTAGVDWRAFQAEWREHIAQVGAQRSYVALKRTASRDAVAVAHGKAHLYGEELYRAAGKKGILTCDTALTFGCYHGIIATALATEGRGALRELDEFCVASQGEDDTGCRHGIGHGLVEYYGAADLTPSLEACGTLTSPTLLGCPQGVFMEYRYANMDGFGRAPGPGEPCVSVPEAYRPACWFEQPYLLRRLFGADDADIASACAALAGDERDACMLGLGRMAAELSNYDADAAMSACALVDERDRPVCVGGAHWLFAAVKRSKPWPCGQLAAHERRACLDASFLVSDVGQ